jgi:hypothetical protein
MKELRDLKDLTIHRVQPKGDELACMLVPGRVSLRLNYLALC